MATSARLSLSAALVVLVLFIGCTLKVGGVRFNIEPYKDQCIKDELRPDALVMGQYSSTYFPKMRLRFWIEDNEGQQIYEHEDNGAHKNKFSFTTEAGGMFSYCFKDMHDSADLDDFIPEDYEDYDDHDFFEDDYGEAGEGGEEKAEGGEAGGEEVKEEKTEEEKLKAWEEKRERAVKRRQERRERIKAMLEAPVAYDRHILLETRVGMETKNYALVARKEALSEIELLARKIRDAISDAAGDVHYVKEREAQMRITNDDTNQRVMITSILSMVTVTVLAFWQMSYLKNFFRSKKLLS